MKTSPRSASFAVVPDWVKPAVADVATFFSALALMGIEGEWVRLRAADQRALIGCVPFGQCAIRSNGDTVEVFRSVCFGTDGEHYGWHHSELAAQIKSGRTARPGVYGRLAL